MKKLMTMLSCGILALVGSACNVPSVPLPPPDPASITFHLGVTPGFASYESDPNATWSRAVVYVFNESKSRGVITVARPDGSVEPALFIGDDGDIVEITYELERQSQLAGLCLILREGRSSPSNRCP